MGDANISNQKSAIDGEKVCQVETKKIGIAS